MQATIDLQILKAAAHATSGEETRYYLKGVCIEINPRSVTYVATDGHLLFAMQQAAGKENTLTGTFIVPLDVIKAVKLGRKLASTATLALSPIGGELLLQQAGAPGVSFQPVDGTFPDWRRVVPGATAAAGNQWQPLTEEQLRKDGGDISQVDPALLARLQKAGRDADLGPHPFLHHAAHGNPLPVTWPGHENAIAVVMPLRLADEAWRVPQWVSSTSAPK